MLKKALTISLCVAFCVTMFGAASLWDASDSAAVAAESGFGDFETDFTTTQSGTSVTASGNKLTVGSSESRASFISTSGRTVDFSRSFELDSVLTDTDAPDGLTLTFQPDGGYAYSSAIDVGSGLCVYAIEGKNKGVKNGLVTEIDTYDSIGKGTDGDIAGFTEALKKHGWTDGDKVMPHIAVSIMDDNSRETVKDACIVTAGAAAARHNVTVRWQITDQKTGEGIYTMTYDNRTISCKLDPKGLFGTTSPYMTITGSVNYNDKVKITDPWYIELGTFSYQAYSQARASLGADLKVNDSTPEGSGEYDFVLKDSSGKVLQTAANSGSTVKFNDITYDSPGTYEYYISQKKGDASGVAYDDTEYKAVVTVAALHDKLETTIRYFKNGVETSPIFADTAQPPHVVISESASSGSSEVSGNEKVKFTITVKNDGKGDATGVRLRRYMPAYTHFYSVDKSGSYGCIDQQEHATWFLKSLPAGASVKLTFTTVVDVCHPDGYRLKNKVYYEVTGNKTAPYVNTASDPSEISEQ